MILHIVVLFFSFENKQAFTLFSIPKHKLYSNKTGLKDRRCPYIILILAKLTYHYVMETVLSYEPETLWRAGGVCAGA